MRCSVLGCNGYIGKHIVYYLKNLGYDPFLYDINDETIANYKQVDITSKESVKSININVDYIFMFAGLTGTYAGFDEYIQYNSINEIGLINLLDFIRKSKFRPKIIFPSTRLVYKGVDKALNEFDEKETKTIYAVNKLACEGILQAYNFNFDIPYTIFRICVPYGNLLTNNYSYGTIGFFINQAKSGKSITLYGDGSLKRTFTHIEDLCYNIIYASFKEESNKNIYNIGGEILSLKDAAQLIANKYKTNIEFIPWTDINKRLESGHTYFDDSKIRSLLNINHYRKLQEFTNIL